MAIPNPLLETETRSVNGVAAAKYVYNGNNLIEERDGTGSTVTAAYFYVGGIDRPVGVIKSGSAYYFQQDALGNVTALTNNNGAIVEQYSYDIYGAPTIKDGSGNVKTTAISPFLFTGREYDSETGLYHYRARAYSPTLGRFLSRDPIAINGGINLYAYVSNNSVNLVDLLGLCPKSWYDYFKEDMNTMGMPAPDSVYTTVVTSLASATASEKLGEASVSLIVRAGTKSEVTLAATAVVASAYVGVAVGSAINATVRSLF